MGLEFCGAEDCAFRRKANLWSHYSANRVHEIFKQSSAYGSTPTASRLWSILNPYIKECEERYDPSGKCVINPPKKLNLIVLTDGVPDESPKHVLLNIGQRLNNIGAETDQLGVMFCQIGRESVSIPFL